MNDDFKEYQPRHRIGTKGISISKEVLLLSKSTARELYERFQRQPHIRVRLFYSQETEQIKIKFDPKKGTLKVNINPSHRGSHAIPFRGFKKQFSIGDEYVGHYDAKLNTYDEIIISLEEKK